MSGGGILYQLEIMATTNNKDDKIILGYLGE